MFLTYDHYKSPLNKFLTTQGENVWMCADVQILRSWFLLYFSESVRDGEESVDFDRTMLMSEFDDAVPFLLVDGKGRFRVKGLHIVTPGILNGTSEWAMDPISQVWLAQQPGETVEQIWVFGTRAGKKYPSNPSSPMGNLLIQSLTFDFR